MQSKRLSLIIIAALLCLFGSHLQAAAGEPELKEAPIVLKLGGSELVNPNGYWPSVADPHFKRVSAINPKLVDVQVISPKLFYVFGKNFGSTSLIIWEKDQEEPKVVDVIVFLDVTGLKQKISELYPSQNIKVYASETGVVLSGSVTGPEIVEQVIRLTQTFLPKLAEDDESKPGTGRSGPGITNLLKVEGVQQVMLEVKFAEINRTASKDWQAGIGLGKLGKDFNGAISAGGSVLTPLQFKPEFSDITGPNGDVIGQMLVNRGLSSVLPGGSLLDGTTEAVIDGLVQPNLSSLLLNLAGNASNVFVNIDNFSLALNLMENEGLARTLAEPRLVTQSGQEASFLAGGEFPIPVPSDDNNGITIEFKEFGVSLRFTPVVLSNGTISLRVAPGVSEIVGSNAIPAGIIGTNFIVPNLSTRKLETTVQLKDGQTLALAGLLQDSLREQVDKIPGLGDLPIIGALFRSSAYLQEKTDLLIAVTPHLVSPVPEGSLQFPGEDMTPPSRFEYYLEGRLEGSRTSDSTPNETHGHMPLGVTETSKGGLEGPYGYQPVE